MTFSDLEFKTFYSTKDDNIPESFYNLVLKEAVLYNRVSGYFSSKSLAYYTKGIQNLLLNKGKMRFIISHEISEQDYEAIRLGYFNKSKLTSDLFKNFNYDDSDVSLKINISNLAYLIEIGLVEIKIGFTHSGLFHAKYGMFLDDLDNMVFFTGSLNESEAAFAKNYEEITVLDSWTQSEQQLRTKLKEFNKLWDGENDDGYIFVKSINEIVRLRLISYSKGKIILNKNMLKNEALILYFNNDLKFQNNLIKQKIDFNQRSINQLSKKYFLDASLTTFKTDLNYTDIEEIIKLLKRYGKRTDTQIIIDDSVYMYIQSNKFQIKEMKKIGLALKNKDEMFKQEFDVFKNIVKQEVDRELYDIQYWLSFYQVCMKRAANFSVPGAGKTSMVYGSFAYLSSPQINKAKRIVVIGPKNSFLSWKEEFRNVFGNKRSLRVLDIHASDFVSEMMYKNTDNYNLVLINYESLITHKEALSKIIDEKTLLVFDEVHKIKRIGSERAKVAIELSCKSTYRLVLTGTPIPNSYQDIWNFLHILYNFEYKQYFGFSQSELSHLSPTESQEINEKLSPFFWRVTKNQLLVPKENEDQLIRVTANDTEQLIIDILWKKYGHQPFKLYIRLIQLSSNPTLLKEKITKEIYGDYGVDEEQQLINYTDELPNYKNYELDLIKSLENSSKFDRCISQSHSLLTKNKPHIIWCIFIDTINKLHDKIQKLGARVAVIYGGIPSEERERIIIDFQAGRYDVLITNPHTLAESISLHMIAHDAIYYEFSFNLTHMLQSRDRIHRLGLKEGQETNYFYLFMDGQEGRRNTIDYKVYSRLSEKKKLMLDVIENQELHCEFSIDEQEEILEIIKEIDNDK
jgi:hypothetical protein